MIKRQMDSYIFVYRDIFFRVKNGALGTAIILVDGRPHGSPFNLELWNGSEFELTTSKLREICDAYIDRLVSESIRASGETLCETCNKKLYEHPYFHGEFAFGNERAYLRRRCDGRLIKL